ncbi:hypothetical protein DFH09DRAFT_1071338 [Mycena vulgaris]|nr:hypothetical protein DFH09DRAFT_1071338 [Mycena vulgaris]
MSWAVFNGRMYRFLRRAMVKMRVPGVVCASKWKGLRWRVRGRCGLMLVIVTTSPFSLSRGKPNRPSRLALYRGLSALEVHVPDNVIEIPAVDWTPELKGKKGMADVGKEHKSRNRLLIKSSASTNLSERLVCLLRKAEFSNINQRKNDDKGALDFFKSQKSGQQRKPSEVEE